MDKSLLKECIETANMLIKSSRFSNDTYLSDREKTCIELLALFAEESIRERK